MDEDTSAVLEEAPPRVLVWNEELVRLDELPLDSVDVGERTLEADLDEEIE